MQQKSVFDLLNSLKLISRKIWAVEKFWNFHTVHSLLCQWAFYVVRVQSMIARWVSMRIDWLSCGDYRLWMGYDDRRPIKLEEELGCFIKINGLKICASLRIFLENSTCSITQQAHMHILLVKLKRKKITFFFIILDYFHSWKDVI